MSKSNLPRAGVSFFRMAVVATNAADRPYWAETVGHTLVRRLATTRSRFGSFAVTAGHMVPSEVGLSRLNMGFGGAASLSLPRGRRTATIATRSASVVPAGTFRRSGTDGLTLRRAEAYRAAGWAPGTNSVPSVQMACMMVASLRATPIAARLNPTRL